MSSKSQVTPIRTLLPSPIERTPPSSTKKRALNELSINLPPRPHSAQEFTTPEHPNQYKKYRKVSEPISAPLSASSLPSSAAKRDSPGEDPVWGSDVESAFMSAIKSIPKLGRRKICIGSKPCGRNELIADFIYRRTGKIRTRKQVSSHIQVLKHIRRDDAEFLALVADGRDGELDEVSPRFDPKDVQTFNSVERHPIMPEEYQLSLPLDEESSPLGQFGRKGQGLAPSRSSLSIEEFCIWATKRFPGSNEDKISHVYSTFEGQHATMPVAPIDSVADWALRFPCLPGVLDDIGRGTCPVYHVRATLNLPDSLDLEGEQQVVLRTQLSMTCMQYRTREAWSCTTRVYTLGSQVLELQQKISMEQLNTQDPNTGMQKNVGLKAAIPFATDFWAAFLAGLASLDQSLQNLSQADRKAKRERDSKNAVAGITVVQEITTLETSLEGSRRLSVLIWEFAKTHASEPGRTLVTRIASAKNPLQDTMRAPNMARSMSQPQVIPSKASRPRLNKSGTSLQRSQSMAALSAQSLYQPQIPRGRIVTQMSASVTYQPVVTHAPGQLPNGPAYYQPMFDHFPAQQDRQNQATAHNGGLQIAYTLPSQTATPHAMSRSYSAPSWTQGSAPTQYPSAIDTSSWNDSFIDWSLPESAGYLQSDFQVASDDFFTTTPSRAHSTIPQSYAMEHTTSTTGTEIDEDAMPRLGFFPLANF